jgi:hypothetical protein
MRQLDSTINAASGSRCTTRTRHKPRPDSSVFKEGRTHSSAPGVAKVPKGASCRGPSPGPFGYAQGKLRPGLHDFLCDLYGPPAIF